MRSTVAKLSGGFTGAPMEIFSDGLIGDLLWSSLVMVILEISCS